MSLPEPLVPADVDLRDFAFMPIDIIPLFGSEFHANATDAEWRAGVTLWLKSYHQVPAASIPDDDVALTRLAELGRDLTTWAKIKVGALRGWRRCNDGRLYHPVVAEKAIDAKRLHHWKRECDRLRKENKIREEKKLAALPSPAKPTELALNSEGTRYEIPRNEPDFPPESEPASSGTPLEKPLKGQGQGQGQIKERNADLAVALLPRPPDPEPTAEPDPSSLGQTDAEIERATFAKARTVLGPRSGGQVTQLVRAKNGSHIQALAVLEAAATKHNPREYVAAIIQRGANGRGPPGALPLRSGAVMDAAAILTEARIELRRTKPGNSKTQCPQCSHLRRNRREPYLSVEIGTTGVRWNCHHCGWAGGRFYDDSQPRNQGHHDHRGPRPERRNSRPVGDLYR